MKVRLNFFSDIKTATCMNFRLIAPMMSIQDFQEAVRQAEIFFPQQVNAKKNKENHSKISIFHKG